MTGAWGVDWWGSRSRSKQRTRRWGVVG